MTGLCGWTWTETERRDGEDHLHRTAKALMHGEEGEFRNVIGRCFALVEAGRPGYSSSFSDDSGCAAIYGKLSSSDPALERRIREEGPAAAILQAYTDGGPACLGTLSGTYMLALFSEGGEKVLLATDQVGSIPVYYADSAEGLLFSTTLRAFRALPHHTLAVDHQAIYQYLFFHTIPTPYSVYRGIRKLRPRHWLQWHKGHVQTGEYRRYQWKPDPDFQPEEAKANFFRLLDTVVERNVDDDGAIGCFLSGGTDSSTLAGVMASRLNRHTRTYSIGFDEPGYDEMDYARIASRHFGTEHHEYYVTRRDVADLIPRICEAYDEPFGNSSAVPTYFCARMAGNDSIRRMIAGDGGDELFGGNSRYSDQLIFSYYDRIPHALRRWLISPAARSLPLGPALTRKPRRYVEQAEIPMPLRMFSYNHLRMLGLDRILHPDFLASIDVDAPAADLSRVYDTADAANMIDRMLALDLKFTITDNDLPKVVTMCDLAGRDVVFPFLEDEMIRFSTTLPPDQKVRQRALRVFFKDALRGFLPDEIIQKKKHGFGLPFGRWLADDKELREIAHDTLTGLGQRGILRIEFIRELLKTRLDEHSAYYGGFAWVLIQLELWYRRHDSFSSAG